MNTLNNEPTIDKEDIIEFINTYNLKPYECVRFHRSA